MSLYYVSDLHLKSNNERNSFLFIEFLKQLQQEHKKARHELFLLGDIFDLWVSDHKVFISRYEAVICELERVKQCGVPIYFFEGNHDVHIDVFFKNKLGIEVFDQGHTFERNGVQIRCEHGDYINPEDVLYHQYLKVIRHPRVEKAGHLLPGLFWDVSGRLGSKLSRKRSSKLVFKKNYRLRDLILQYSEQVYEKEKFDILITGHVHFRMNEMVGQKYRTINLGSWFEDPQVLKIDLDNPKQIQTSWLSYADGIFQAL